MTELGDPDRQEKCSGGRMGHEAGAAEAAAFLQAPGLAETEGAPAGLGLASNLWGVQACWEQGGNTC